MAVASIFLLEVLVVAGCLVRPVLLLAQPGFRRKLQAFPHAEASLVGGTLGVAVIFALAAVWYQPLFHTGAALALLTLAWDAIRSRSRHGVASGLPPGSLALAPLRPWRDQEFFRKRALEHGAYFKFCHVHRPTICVIGLDRGHDLLRVHADRLSASALPFNRNVPRGFMRYMGRADRKQYHAVIASVVSRDVVQAGVPSMARSIRNDLPIVVAAFGGARSNAGGPVSVLNAMTGRVFLALFFGFETDEERQNLLCPLEAVDFRRAARRSAADIRRGLEEAESILRRQAGRLRDGRRVQPESFLESLVRDHPELADDRTVLLNLAYMWQLATADVAGMLHWCIVALGSSAEWRMRLESELAQASPGETSRVAPATVQETLRMDQSEYLIRVVTDEFWYGGFRFPKGYLVRVCVRESHRLDPAVPHADTFDPGRFMNGGMSPHHFSPFGHGPGACLGEHLALTMGSCFLSELTAAYRWRIIERGAAEYGGFHWRPGPRCLMAATPR